MNRWVKIVARQIAERALLREKQRVLVAVSGGVDSMVLLHVLHQLSPATKWRLVAGHFNHQLRGRAADEDERLVRTTADKLGIPFRAGRADVRGHAKAAGLSLEMAGRELRHRFLAETAVAEACECAALAHHLDDQVELFFLRLLRGAGNEGIAGMKWRSSSPANLQVHIVRPLLAQSRADILKFATGARLQFHEDATNFSMDIPRNRIRKKLVPLLVKWQPACRQHIGRLMEIAGAEADLITNMAKEWMAGGQFAAFETLPVAVQRRCLERNLITLGVPVSFDLLEALRLRPGVKVSTGEDAAVHRTPGGNLEKTIEKPDRFDAASVALSLAGKTGTAKFGGCEVKWRHSASRPDFLSDGRASGMEVFDGDLVGEKVVLRYWRAGDRFQPCGMTQAKKLQDIFVNLKVPRAERSRHLIGATASGKVFWVEGLRISEEFKVTPGTKTWLRWRWRR